MVDIVSYGLLYLCLGMATFLILSGFALIVYAILKGAAQLVEANAMEIESKVKAKKGCERGGAKVA